MMKQNYKPEQIIERFNQLKSDRQTWESHWQEITDYFIPRKASVTTKPWPGQKRNTHLFDNTGIHSSRLLAGFLSGLLTNPNSFWFELTTGDLDLDQDEEVREYLQEVVRIMHIKMNNSNFQTEVHELYLDLTTISTSLMFILEDDEFDLRFDSHHISRAVIAENNFGLVDEVHRRFEWDARKIISEYGAKNVHENVLKSYKSGRDDKFDIIQSIYPSDLEANRGSRRFISQHVLVEERFNLRESGFDTFPAVAPRWEKATDEMYGRGPGVDALPEVKMLNKLAEITMRGGQKVVDPPLNVPDDSILGGKKPNLRPAGLNYYRSGTTDRIEPMIQNTRVDFGIDLMKFKEAKIRDTFFVNQLQLREGPQMTATEVLQRTEEAQRLMGPMLGRMQHEFLRPLIDRVFDILARRGRFPEAPEALQGRKIDVQFSSLIAKSQRTGEGQSALRGLEAMGAVGQVQPEIFDLIDGDKYTKFVAEVFGMPQRMFRRESEVKDIRDGRAQAQQQAEQMAQQQAQADMVSKVGPAMAANKGSQEG